MSGAAVFAAEAAYRTGTGLVKVYTHSLNRTVIGNRIPEAVLMTYSDEVEALKCARMQFRGQDGHSCGTWTWQVRGS